METFKPSVTERINHMGPQSLVVVGGVAGGAPAAL